MPANHPFIKVAIPIPIDKEFTYKIPESLLSRVSTGKMLLVPFGKRVITAYAVEFQEKTDLKGVKEVIDVFDDEPIFDEERLKFYRWMASYYFSPLGEILKLTHPPRLNMKNKKERFACLAQNISEDIASQLKKTAPVQAKIVLFLSDKTDVSLSVLRKELGNIDSAIKKLKDKGIIKVFEKDVERNPVALQKPSAPVFHKPNKEQASAISLITEAIQSGKFSPFLLHGVTGSGKTLVYLKAIEECLNMGKKAIVLVPEISLTYWLIQHLASRFLERVAVMHSGLSDGERYDQWKKIRDGSIDIVVGARSALFAPLKDIGIIIVDEEHETSYKQEDGVRYNARDAGIMLAKMLNAVVVLGSATPSIETFYNAQQGKIRLISLDKRIEERPMPDVEIVDMRNESQKHAPEGSNQGSKVKSLPLQAVSRGQKHGEIISEKLKHLLDNALDKKQQAILFLNRRGFSNFLICKDCGHVFKCLNCSVSMTFHKAKNILKCHYCDMSMPVPDLCPKCNGYNVKDIGIGTEKVEEEARRLFPKIRIARMDRDTTRKKRAHERILSAVESGEADMLVGTQMVAKGHHFPNVSVMGIVSSDALMNIPDFRSAERTFQIITQAAGRAGRGDAAGNVVVQTFNPEHYCFKGILRHDYIGFFKQEIEIRKEVFYPPFCRLINLRIEGNKEKKVIDGANVLKRIADKHIKGFKDIILLGPVSAFLSLLKGKYRWHMLVKGKNVKTLHTFAQGIIAEFKQNKISGIELIVDVDPVTTV
ncbi:MAG: primosomal protein N' [Deltaproteobacteria bacterium]|nr:primosomal protein N' [Deltaproteobacteria bacterium]